MKLFADMGLAGDAHAMDTMELEGQATSAQNVNTIGQNTDLANNKA
jgi:hypothetical protein